MNGWSSRPGDNWDDEPAWVYEITWEWEPIPGQRYPGDPGRRKAVHTPVYEASRGAPAPGSAAPVSGSGRASVPSTADQNQSRYEDARADQRGPAGVPQQPREEPAWNRPGNVHSRMPGSTPAPEQRRGPAPVYGRGAGEQPGRPFPEQPAAGRPFPEQQVRPYPEQPGRSFPDQPGAGRPFPDQPGAGRSFAGQPGQSGGGIDRSGGPQRSGAPGQPMVPVTPGRPGSAAPMSSAPVSPGHERPQAGRIPQQSAPSDATGGSGWSRGPQQPGGFGNQPVSPGRGTYGPGQGPGGPGTQGRPAGHQGQPGPVAPGSSPYGSGPSGPGGRPGGPGHRGGQDPTGGPGAPGRHEGTPGRHEGHPGRHEQGVQGRSGGPAAPGGYAPGQGIPGQGVPGQGAPGQGGSGQGRPGQGIPGQGAPGQGASGQDAAYQGRRHASEQQIPRQGGESRPAPGPVSPAGQAYGAARPAPADAFPAYSGERRATRDGRPSDAPFDLRPAPQERNSPAPSRPAAQPTRVTPQRVMPAAVYPTVPGQTSAIPSQTSAIPSQTSAIPSQGPAVPRQTSGVPGQGPAVPRQSRGVPGGVVPVSGPAAPGQYPYSPPPVETTQAVTAPGAVTPATGPDASFPHRQAPSGESFSTGQRYDEEQDPTRPLDLRRLGQAAPPHARADSVSTAEDPTRPFGLRRPDSSGNAVDRTPATDPRLPASPVSGMSAEEHTQAIDPRLFGPPASSTLAEQHTQAIDPRLLGSPAPGTLAEQHTQAIDPRLLGSPAPVAEQQTQAIDPRLLGSPTPGASAEQQTPVAEPRLSSTAATAASAGLGTTEEATMAYSADSATAPVAGSPATGEPGSAPVAGSPATGEPGSAESDTHGLGWLLSLSGLGATTPVPEAEADDPEETAEITELRPLGWFAPGDSDEDPSEDPSEPGDSLPETASTLRETQDAQPSADDTPSPSVEGPTESDDFWPETVDSRADASESRADAGESLADAGESWPEPGQVVYETEFPPLEISTGLAQQDEGPASSASASASASALASASASASASAENVAVDAFSPLLEEHAQEADPASTVEHPASDFTSTVDHTASMESVPSEDDGAAAQFASPQPEPAFTTGGEVSSASEDGFAYADDIPADAQHGSTTAYQEFTEGHHAAEGTGSRYAAEWPEAAPDSNSDSDRTLAESPGGSFADDRMLEDEVSEYETEIPPAGDSEAAPVDDGTAASGPADRLADHAGDVHFAEIDRNTGLADVAPDSYLPDVDPDPYLMDVGSDAHLTEFERDTGPAAVESDTHLTEAGRDADPEEELGWPANIRHEGSVDPADGGAEDIAAEPGAADTAFEPPADDTTTGPTVARADAEPAGESENADEAVEDAERGDADGLGDVSGSGKADEPSEADEPNQAVEPSEAGEDVEVAEAGTPVVAPLTDRSDASEGGAPDVPAQGLRSRGEAASAEVTAGETGSREAAPEAGPPEVKAAAGLAEAQAGLPEVKVEPVRQRRDQRAPSDRRRADPEQILAGYPWTYDPQTLREQVDEPDRLWDVADRLTDRLEFAERDNVRAGLLSLRAVVHRILGELDDALADGREAVRHAGAGGELRALAVAQARLAHVLQWRGEFDEADRIYARIDSVELPSRVRAEISELAGRSAFEQGRYLEAVNHFERALGVRQEEDPELVERIELALDAISRRSVGGWGPYARGRDKLLGVPPAPVPLLDDGAGLWGYAAAVEPRYAEVQPFAEGLAWVRRPGSPAWELIDRRGELVIPSAHGYSGVGPFGDGLAWVMRNGDGGWFAIDRQNQLVVPARGIEEARPFRRGLAPVRHGGVWGAVDRQGRVAVQPRFQRFATALHIGGAVDGFTDEGLAVVEADDRFGVVDRTGRLVVATVHAAVVIHPSAFLVQNAAGLWGALDRQGSPLVDMAQRDAASVVGLLPPESRPVL